MIGIRSRVGGMMYRTTRIMRILRLEPRKIFLHLAESVVLKLKLHLTQFLNLLSVVREIFVVYLDRF